MNTNIASFIFKTLIVVVFLLLALSVINSISLIYAIRPSVVMTYFLLGGAVSSIALNVIDKFIYKKEDPLPEYVLKELEINKKEIMVLKKELEEQYNISPEEVTVRAKAQRRLEEDRKGAKNENKKRP